MTSHVFLPVPVIMYRAVLSEKLSFGKVNTTLVNLCHRNILEINRFAVVCCLCSRAMSSRQQCSPVTSVSLAQMSPLGLRELDQAHTAPVGLYNLYQP